jgi:SAM-dependent methyltransferase
MSPITPQEFVSKWKRVTSRERQAYQEHFIDLCHLVGHQTPNDYDPTGTRFAFEMGAGKTSGGQGWADVAKLGYFGWEYKGKDHDLDKAYAQLLLYREALQNPPALVVSDINHIIIRTNYTNLPTRTFDLTLDDLLDPRNVALLKAVFFNPDELKPRETVAEVTKEAARRFSKLADNLRKYGEEPTQVAHFLIRLLFCLFAEDIGLLPKRFFPQLLHNTRRNSRDFAEALRQLFRAMQFGGMYGSERILHFNGGLFDDDLVLQLDTEGMDILAGIDALDWSAIEPSIFGTLFERGLDPAKRSQLGAHYTDKSDILLIVEPVLMAPLRREWEALKADCLAERARADELVDRKREKAFEAIRARLMAFSDKIASTRVLDPACGSGNFLYVSLQLLLDLQHEVVNFSDELGLGRFFISAGPRQLYGIETNEYAYELAQVTIWIGFIQWMISHGYGHSEPVLQVMDNIHHMDAILAFDADGKPVEPEWPAADVILGNPPFLGDKKMRAELGHEYVETLRKLYEGRLPGGSDLVCYWFEKARAMIERGQVKRAGLLATNSIRGGANRKVLERIKESGNIFWAWADRDWFLDGAAVRVSMIGFDNRAETQRQLDGHAVTEINSDLSFRADIATSAFPLHENAGLCFLGMMKAGAFDVSRELAEQMLRDTGNPNGRPNSDVVKPRLGGQDVVRENRETWIIDFGVDMPIEQAAQYEEPFQYILENVKPERDKNRRTRMKEKWWIHGEARPGLRNAIKKLSRCIVTPEVAKHRIFVWMNTNIVPDHKLHVIARDDDYFFGVLHSTVHETWTLATCSWMGVGNDPSYSSSRTFETFPFPWPPGREPADDPRVQAIAQAARELVEMRDRWMSAEGLSESEKKKRTITNLYNARPTWLHLAHEKLDAAVFAAYGWPADLADDEILERLLALNLERVNK